MAKEEIINGVDVGALRQTAEQVQAKSELGRFRFRSHTEWQKDGAHSRTTLSDFWGAGRMNDGRHFELEADEHPVLLGNDQGPNPVEYLLTALGTCLTGALVYHAAARGLRIDELECDLEGELDVRGFLGIAPDVRKGYQKITATFRVKSDATAEQLEECARTSPVLDVVTNGTKVDLRFETSKGREAQSPTEPPQPNV